MHPVTTLFKWRSSMPFTAKAKPSRLLAIQCWRTKKRFKQVPIFNKCSGYLLEEVPNSNGRAKGHADQVMRGEFIVQQVLNLRGFPFGKSQMKGDVGDGCGDEPSGYRGQEVSQGQDTQKEEVASQEVVNVLFWENLPIQSRKFKTISKILSWFIKGN